MDDFNGILDSVLEEPDKILIGNKEVSTLPKESVKPKSSTGKPGRPRKLDPLSNSIENLGLVVKPDSDLVEKVEDPKVIKNPLHNNKLLDIIKKKGFNSDLEKEAISIVAEEIAYLGAVREAQFNENLDTSKISLRRVQSIQSLLEIIAKKQAESTGSGNASFDFSSDTFRRVFKHILGTVSRTFDEVGIPDKFKQIFFVSLSKNLENFEQEANAIVKGKEIIPGKEVEKDDYHEEED